MADRGGRAVLVGLGRTNQRRRGRAGARTVSTWSSPTTDPTDAVRAAAADLGLEPRRGTRRRRARPPPRGAVELIPAPGLPDRHPVFAAGRGGRRAGALRARPRRPLGRPAARRRHRHRRQDDGHRAGRPRASSRRACTAVVVRQQRPAAGRPPSTIPRPRCSSSRRRRSGCCTPSASPRPRRPGSTWRRTTSTTTARSRTTRRRRRASGSGRAPTTSPSATPTTPSSPRHLRGRPGRTPVDVLDREASTADWRVAGRRACAAPTASAASSRSTSCPRRFEHDLANGLAAVAVAAPVGATPSGAADALRSFTGLAHRLALVAEVDGVRWYDSSKATTPHAALNDVAAVGSAVLIAGGRNKGLDLSVLADGGAVGARRRRHRRGRRGGGGGLRRRPSRRRSGRRWPRRSTRRPTSAEPGDAVVLAPGCASFDWYRSYGERGDDFASLVHRPRRRGRADGLR